MLKKKKKSQDTELWLGLSLVLSFFICKTELEDMLLKCVHIVQKTLVRGFFK